jgi:hypothetical protein
MSNTLLWPAYFSLFSSGLAIMFTQILVLVTFVIDHDCGLVNLDQKEQQQQEEMGFLSVASGKYPIIK